MNNQARRYSSTEVGSKRLEFGVSSSSSFQENLSKICESIDDAEEDEEGKSSNIPQSVETEDRISDENKNWTAKNVLNSSSSVESDEGPSSRKTSMSDDEATVSFEPNSSKKKSNFEKTKNKIHKGFKRLSISDNLFSNSHSGRRMSLPLFTALPDFKHKISGTKSSSVDKPDKPSEEEKSVPSGPTYVNMVDEKPELFAPLDSEFGSLFNLNFVIHLLFFILIICVYFCFRYISLLLQYSIKQILNLCAFCIVTSFGIGEKKNNL